MLLIVQQQAYWRAWQYFFLRYKYTVIILFALFAPNFSALYFFCKHAIFFAFHHLIGFFLLVLTYLAWIIPQKALLQTPSYLKALPIKKSSLLLNQFCLLVVANNFFLFPFLVSLSNLLYFPIILFLQFLVVNCLLSKSRKFSSFLLFLSRKLNNRWRPPRNLYWLGFFFLPLVFLLRFCFFSLILRMALIVFITKVSRLDLSGFSVFLLSGLSIPWAVERKKYHAYLSSLPTNRFYWPLREMLALMILFFFSEGLSQTPLMLSPFFLMILLYFFQVRMKKLGTVLSLLITGVYVYVINANYSH